MAHLTMAAHARSVFRGPAGGGPERSEDPPPTTQGVAVPGSLNCDCADSKACEILIDSSGGVGWYSGAAGRPGFLPGACMPADEHPLTFWEAGLPLGRGQVPEQARSPRPVLAGEHREGGADLETQHSGPRLGLLGAHGTARSLK